MKKKFLTFALIICFILPCAILLSACGKSDPTISSISFQFDGQDSDVIYLGTKSYGENFAAEESEVKLILNYSDGSKEEVEQANPDELTMVYKYNGVPVDSAGSRPSAGNYIVEVTYKGFTASWTYDITQAEMPTSVSVRLSKQLWYYSDANPTPVFYNRPTDLADATWNYYYTSKEVGDAFIGGTGNLSYIGTFTPGEYESIQPGEYYLYAEMTNSLNYFNGKTTLFAFEVQKGRVSDRVSELPTTNYTYLTGMATEEFTLADVDFVDPGATFKTPVPSDSGVEGEYKEIEGYYVWTNPNQAISCESDNGRSYPISFLPIDPNYAQQNNVGVAQLVLRKEATGLSITGGNLTRNYNETSTNGLKLYEYNSNFDQEKFETYVLIEKYNTTTSQWESFEATLLPDSGYGALFDTSAKNIGTYKYRFVLKDGGNTVWGNDVDTDLKEPIEVQYEIQPAPIDIVFANYNTVEVNADGTFEFEIVDEGILDLSTLQVQFLERNSLETESEIYCHQGLTVDTSSGKIKVLGTVTHRLSNEHDYTLEFFVRVSVNGIENYEQGFSEEITLWLERFDAREVLSDAYQLDNGLFNYLGVDDGTLLKDVIGNLPEATQHGTWKVELKRLGSEGPDDIRWIEVGDFDTEVLEYGEFYEGVSEYRISFVPAGNISSSPAYVELWISDESPSA